MNAVELPGAVSRCRIINDMIVYMGFVDMDCNDESNDCPTSSALPFRSPLDLLLMGLLSGLEGLAHRIGDDVILLLSAVDMLILPFGKKKLFIPSLEITLI